jgi:hypothetical protein
MLDMTILSSHKILAMIFPVSVLVGGCAGQAMADTDQEQSAEDQAATASRKATATIANLLPADGCSYPVTIDGTDYAPNDGSMDVVHDLVQAGQTVTARISYRLTGGTSTVTCGFGRTVELPEIAFRVIFVIDDGTSLESSATPAG